MPSTIKPAVQDINEGKIIWQETDDAVPEQAIMVVFNEDSVIELRQQNDCILLNTATIDELCKILKKGKSKK